MQGVDTEYRPYKPEKSGPKRNTHVTLNFERFAMLAAYGALLQVILQILYVIVSIHFEELTFVLWSIERAIRVSWMFILSGPVMIIADWMVDGNIFKGIIQTPMSCALYASALFIGVVLVCIGG